MTVHERQNVSTQVFKDVEIKGNQRDILRLLEVK